MTVVPSRKVTVPVGLTPLPVSVAVKVTALLIAMELADEARAITGVALLTITVCVISGAAA
jgi:hypothetical protein